MAAVRFMVDSVSACFFMNNKTYKDMSARRVTRWTNARNTAMRQRAPTANRHSHTLEGIHRIPT